MCSMRLLCGPYLYVDFARLFNCFLLDECDHALELIGDLLIAQTM
jgi:hypothetical protein